MNQAERIFAKFGGMSKCAKALGLTPSTVFGWKERGIIPQEQQARIVKAARARGIELTAADLLVVDVPGADFLLTHPFFQAGAGGDVHRRLCLTLIPVLTLDQPATVTITVGTQENGKLVQPAAPDPRGTASPVDPKMLVGVE